MPFLIPPSEFMPSELDGQGLTGTCELQVCRSAGSWSMGFQHRMEHSIQNAYLKGVHFSR
jgi:phospholipase D1/2